jgi:hypothetical protein
MLSFSVVQCAMAALSVEVSNDGAYKLSVDNQLWLSSGQTRLHGVNLIAQSLKRVGGHDSLGEFIDIVQEFSCETQQRGQQAQPCFSTIVRDYTSSIPLVVFLQRHIVSRNDTSVGGSVEDAKEDVLSAFPSFRVGENSDLGYMAYYNQMVGGMEEGTRYGAWDLSSDLVGGTQGGPYVLFDAPQTRALVLSPWSNFMAGSAVQRRQPDSEGRSPSASHSDPASFLEFGLLGSIDSIPAGFEFATAAYLGHGVNAAVRGFGALLLRKYGKPGTPWEGAVARADVSLSKLGLSTDNGAYYYYWSGNFSSPEAALIAAERAAAAQRLPFHYVLLDSWWYYQGAGHGVSNWTARPDAFPHGLANFSKVTRWPIVGHNRYWASDTTYAKQNGGEYDFIIERVRLKALPTEQRFWDHLMASSKKWGLAVYEQDWLHNEWEGLHATLQSATLSREWLLQMGRAASKSGLKIQYCMAYPRFALASVEVPAVDQIRVSDDYQVDLTRSRSYPVNLYVGTSSMLAAAVGLAPSKDTWWSRRTFEPENPKYHGSAREDHAPVEAAVASYTAGPVQPGDAAGQTDRALVMCTCTADGTLLKPSWPATPIDDYFSQRVWSGSLSRPIRGPDGELYASYTALDAYTAPAAAAAPYTVVHILAIDLNSSFVLQLARLGSQVPGFSHSSPRFTWRANTAACADSLPADVNVSFGTMPSSLALHACARDDFQLVHVAPAINCGNISFGLLGEAGKWVPVSTQRFSSVRCTAGTAHAPSSTASSSAASPSVLSVAVTGVAGETVAVRFGRSSPGQHADVVSATCVFRASGTATAASDGSCRASRPEPLETSL